MPNKAVHEAEVPSSSPPQSHTLTKKPSGGLPKQKNGKGKEGGGGGVLAAVNKNAQMS